MVDHHTTLSRNLRSGYVFLAATVAVFCSAVWSGLSPPLTGRRLLQLLSPEKSRKTPPVTSFRRQANVLFLSRMKSRCGPLTISDGNRDQRVHAVSNGFPDAATQRSRDSDIRTLRAYA